MSEFGLFGDSQTAGYAGGTKEPLALNRKLKLFMHKVSFDTKN